jgi:serine phosphatase RsbU (regulator of sigma subunit)
VVELSSDLPFGVEVGERNAATIELSPGDALFAFTDGLVERRGEDIDVGIQRLADSIARTSWHTAGTLVNSAVSDATAHGLPDDDVTVLMLRRRSPTETSMR